ncbi:zf-HC2 domain-containing protein [Anaerotignum lactatifermentans]|uniref:Anti-sigma-W factor RsiW n=1 Tax=Anaerotignum lactatifermentans TaxID=160404 RepID=A0ABS2GA82_9FIRM|nr:zf-HC2 domain-containing protein [Anaerotignum lactatifermentans]MBM6829233.1 zf-HC2 domain-containing protein [Anaerotignum lactatifermentans]MBM6877527.1 zf-HC2 domain-containing protein [Anaerotignum lactatifermentans]MBM6950811.1 zf-HC2 domain-containing protein [Anaerotignum lactatifermentans]
MKCEDCREQLWALFGGELPEEEAQRLRAHLAKCPACAEEAKLIQNLSKTLRDLPEEELPSGFHDELMQKLGREKEARLEDTKAISPSETEGKVVPFPGRKKPGRRNFGLIAAAVVLVAVLGGSQGILQMRSSQDAVVQEMMEQADADSVQTKVRSVQEDTAQTEEVTGTENEQLQAQTGTGTTPAVTKKEQTANYASNAKTGEETSSEKRMDTASAPQTSNTTANEESLDVMPMTASQIADGQPGLRSVTPAQEDVALKVADVPAAMTQVEAIAEEMSLTEVEKTENSLTYAMAESQKPAFLEELKEVGTHEAQAAVTDSQNEIWVKVTFETQTTE